MQQNKHLLVIPAFNEEPTIRGLIHSARRHVPDVMVVDDGSEDTTVLAAALSGAMVHRLPRNMGKGEALKTGFSYAIDQNYDWVFTLDGDGQHDPKDLQRFFPLLESYDLILGSRMSDASRIPFRRRWANWFLSLIVSILSFRRIEDSQTGFRAYRTRMLREVRLDSSHYEMETEVVIKAARKRFRIGHCRIQAVYAGEISRVDNIRDGGRLALVLLKSFFWWR
jgi:glycosyltransferase involved in cell wall biosynthesis